MGLKERIGIDLGRKIAIEDGVYWAAQNNVRYVDAQVDLAPNAIEEMGDRAATVNKLCRDYGVHLGLHTLSAVNIAEVSSPMASSVDEYLRTYIDLARATGAGWVVVHAGYHFSADYTIRKQAGLERLKRAGDYAEKNGVTLLLENMNREPDDAEVKYLCSTLDECIFYFENIDSPSIKWSFTANHAHLWPEHGISGFLSRLDLAKCREVRLADCRGTVEEHLQPGEGTIDFGEMFRMIEKQEYKGHYMCAWGGLDDMLRGREHLVAEAEKAGIR